MDVYGLIGNPVGHSLSPPMHEAAYDALGLDARYVTFEPDEDAAVDAVAGADALGVAGLNVTVPFKRDVAAAVETDDLASAVGAVNTLDFSGETVTGHNTDVEGAVRALREQADAKLEGSTAVVVGAGGAGRAVAFGLADAGASVRVANRTVERAESLAADVSRAVDGATVGARGLDDLVGALADADVLVNATSVGMEEDETPVPAAALHGGLVVLDAVYAPLETRLLRDATAAGARTVDGAWMLLYQGAAAFERWTDEPAPVDAMNDALRNGLSQ
ncbi:shikimate dehydrogenase [Halorubellus sp. JP-L1]|uniref:shikimate dehydrogenase n=1 Tax=Halorubellus sp. JP-L1 TaxID=2715753 RepID=UPI00140E566C|nr:shikimate dehydrogenase [Halorubellus sp. JP-L1]NHN42395.1 shikimate dehydrogenase [Halorubellus sp. JP-L1]